MLCSIYERQLHWIHLPTNYKANYCYCKSSTQEQSIWHLFMICEICQIIQSEIAISKHVNVMSKKQKYLYKVCLQLTEVFEEVFKEETNY